MSGGRFDYIQNKLEYYVEDLERIIAENDESDCFHRDTILEFKYCVYLMRKTAVYMQRVDWLVSGDDGEEYFHKRLTADLGKLRHE